MSFPIEFVFIQTIFNGVFSTNPLNDMMKGISINSFDLNGKSFPLIWGGDAANYSTGSNPEISKHCLTGSMNSYKVRGKIVFCETDGPGTGIRRANGVGTIMAYPSIPDAASNYLFPATVISTEDGLKVLEYIKSTE